jgi:uncharacterized membrane protein
MRSRWLTIGLIVSVTLNLFLIGAGAGVVWIGMRMARENAMARAGALVRATRDLPQADRHAMRQMLRQAWLEVKAPAEQSRALRLKAWGSIADPAANAAEIKQELAQSRQLDTADRTTVEEKVVDYALGLPPADRKIFADGMLRVLTPPRPANPPKPPAPPAKP